MFSTIEMRLAVLLGTELGVSMTTVHSINSQNAVYLTYTQPLIISGILLALREAESKNFSIGDLTGDDINTDGEKIYNAIESNLKRSRVSPEVKRDKILSQFSIVKDTHILNELNIAN